MFKRGFVPPSGLLDPIDIKKVDAFNKNYSNSPIRLGVISKVHEIDDEKNQSKLFVEYDVVTSQQNEQMGQGFVEYTNCVCLDAMGGIADFFEFKKRPYDKENFRDTYQFDKQDGSMVLILCIDGFTDKGVIIGGVGHPARDTKLSKDKGLHLEGEYNGLNWQVNKDGEFQITFKSNTDSKGKPSNESAGGSYFKIDKSGSINLDTAADDATNIILDKEKKDVNINAGAKITAVAKQDISMTTDAKITGKAKGGVEFEAEGTAKISAKSSLSIESKAPVNVKGANILMEAQNGVLMQAQQVLIDAPTVIVGQGGTPAVTLNTKFIGTGAFGVQVVSSAVGPFSGSVLIGA